MVIFGMFNIITAIFVEATMNGLKDSETERKYAQAYESNYMTEQLAKLAPRRRCLFDIGLRCEVMCISKQVEAMREETRSKASVPLV